MKLKETADRMQNKERKRTTKKEREGEASLKSTSRKKRAEQNICSLVLLSVLICIGGFLQYMHLCFLLRETILPFQTISTLRQWSALNEKHSNARIMDSHSKVSKPWQTPAAEWSFGEQWRSIYFADNQQLKYDFRLRYDVTLTLQLTNFSVRSTQIWQWAQTSLTPQPLTGNPPNTQAYSL